MLVTDPETVFSEAIRGETKDHDDRKTGQDEAHRRRAEKQSGANPPHQQPNGASICMEHTKSSQTTQKGDGRGGSVREEATHTRRYHVGSAPREALA